MKKNFAVLLACSVVFGPSAFAGEVRDFRIAKAEMPFVLEQFKLETLQSRDKKMLEDLAEALQHRYGGLLSGIELILTKQETSGTVFYRMDFVGMNDREQAREICRILETDRCIAMDSLGQMVLLNLESDNSVSALGVIASDDKVIALNEESNRLQALPIERPARLLAFLEQKKSEKGSVDKDQKEQIVKTVVQLPKEKHQEDAGKEDSELDHDPDKKTLVALNPISRNGAISGVVGLDIPTPIFRPLKAAYLAGASSPTPFVRSQEAALFLDLQIPSPQKRSLTANLLASARVDGPVKRPQLLTEVEIPVPNRRDFSNILASDLKARKDLAYVADSERQDNNVNPMDSWPAPSPIQRSMAMRSEQEIVGTEVAVLPQDEQPASSMKLLLDEEEQDREIVQIFKDRFEGEVGLDRAGPTPKKVKTIRIVASEATSDKEIKDVAAQSAKLDEFSEIPEPLERAKQIGYFHQSMPVIGDMGTSGKQADLVREKDITVADGILSAPVGPRAREIKNVTFAEGNLVASLKKAIPALNEDKGVVVDIPAAVATVNVVMNELPGSDSQNVDKVRLVIASKEKETPYPIEDHSIDRQNDREKENIDLVATNGADISKKSVTSIDEFEPAATGMMSEVVFNDQFAEASAVPGLEDGRLQKMPIKRELIIAGMGQENENPVFQVHDGNLIFSEKMRNKLAEKSGFDVAQVPQTVMPTTNLEKEPTQSGMDFLKIRNELMRPGIADVKKDDPGAMQQKPIQDVGRTENSDDTENMNFGLRRTDDVGIANQRSAGKIDPVNAEHSKEEQGEEGSPRSSLAIVSDVLDQITKSISSNQKENEIVDTPVVVQKQRDDVSELHRPVDTQSVSDDKIGTETAARDEEGFGVVRSKANKNLMIDLSYVDSRQAVETRVEDLRYYIPAAMLRQGRFFGALSDKKPGKYVVGLEANDEKALSDITWYLDKMKIRWDYH